MKRETPTGPKEITPMANDTSKGKLGRRDFLRTLGIGATAAAAAPFGDAHADSETNEEKRKARYKETEHVKAYYRVNRYPS
jgi:hypothetical protein